MERNNLLRTFVDNHIVLRDLRATMRGTRAFWFQAVYLGLLGILAVTGYAISTQQNLWGGMTGSDYASRTFSIVDAQRQLQSFYYFIFFTLAGLITLITPALTASTASRPYTRNMSAMVAPPSRTHSADAGSDSASNTPRNASDDISFPASISVAESGVVMSRSSD